MDCPQDSGKYGKRDSLFRAGCIDTEFGRVDVFGTAFDTGGDSFCETRRADVYAEKTRSGFAPVFDSVCSGEGRVCSFGYSGASS